MQLCFKYFIQHSFPVFLFLSLFIHLFTYFEIEVVVIVLKIGNLTGILGEMCVGNIFFTLPDNAAVRHRHMRK